MGNGWAGFFVGLVILWIFTSVKNSLKGSAKAAPLQQQPTPTSYRSPYQRQQSHYGVPPVISRVSLRAELTWCEPERLVQIGSISFNSGLVYLCDGFSDEPSAINTMLPVARSGDGAEKLPYYPSYSQFSPAQRTCYLQWLAAGRTDANPASRDFGYLFTFFYGLERRLFIDEDHSESLATAAATILQEYAAFGVSHSLSNYFSSYLHFWGFTQGAARYAQLWPWIVGLPNSILREDAVRLVLHSLSAWGKPLPAEVAFDVMLNNPEVVKPSIALRKHGSPFHELFLARFREALPNGAPLINPGTSSKVEYLSGNIALRGFSMSAGRKRNLSVQVNRTLIDREAGTRCMEVWNQAVSEMKRYERVTKHVSPSGFSIRSFTALPKELRTKQVETLRPQWQQFVSSIGTVDGHVILKTSSLAGFLGIGLKDWLTNQQIDDISVAAQAFSYEIAPAPADYGSRWRAEQEVALIPLTGREPGKHSPPFLGIAALIQMAAHIATSNGVVDAGGGEMTKALVDSSGCTQAEQEHLRALANLLLRDTDNAPRSLSAVVKNIPAESAASMARTLTRIAAADGVITLEEEKALYGLFRQLHVPRALGRGMIAEVGEPREVVAEGADAPVRGEAIPRPSKKAPARRPLSLDHKKVEAIEIETREVIAMLSRVMEESESESEPAPFEPVLQKAAVPVMEGPDWTMGLDPQFVPLAARLAGKDQWSQEELKAVASEYHLIPSAAVDAINAWAEDALGDFLLVGDEPVSVQKHLLTRAPT
jgi:hypothetical protein